jgi:hypothetical protein
MLKHVNCNCKIYTNELKQVISVFLFLQQVFMKKNSFNTSDITHKSMKYPSLQTEKGNAIVVKLTRVFL